MNTLKYDTFRNNFYINLTARNSSISIKTDNTVQIKIFDQDKKTLQNVVNKQKINIIQSRDSQVSLASERNHNITGNQTKPGYLNYQIQHNSIKSPCINNNDKSYHTNDNNINNNNSFLQSRLSQNNNKESKVQTINRCGTLKSISKLKDSEDHSKILTQSNNAEAQELRKQQNEGDIQLKKIKEELSKCQNELQIEREQNKWIKQQLSQQQIELQKERQQNIKIKEELTKYQNDLQIEREQIIIIKQQFSECQNDLQIERKYLIKMKEETSRLNEILSQKQIQMDQLQCKNNAFLQVIKRIDENISSIYQKEVKIQVKQI